MKRTISSIIVAGILGSTLVAAPITARAEQPQEQDGHIGYSIGSVLLSILHVPLKLVTCVGTGAISTVAYVGTYGVEGNYDGGTNGREIGEVARRACGGDWIIPAEQVKEDYQ